MAGFLTRVDDALNPIVVKELRQAVKSRFVVSVLLLFLVIQLGFIGFQLLALGVQGRIDSLDFQGGREVFTALQLILLATCLLFIPLYTAIRLAAERNEANVDLLFVTTIQPRSIIAGKIVSAIILAILIFSACMPFMGLTYYLRGIDWATILFVLAIDFVVVIVSVQLMVFLAVVPTNIIFKTILGLFGLYCLSMNFMMTMEATSVMARSELVNRMDRVEFWATCGGTLLMVMGLGGLFFTWSVALISSPSSNRAFAVRLYMLALTLVSSPIAMALSVGVRVEGPFLLWMWVATILASVYAVIAINERREWSPRIARRIPKSIVGRLVAFPLFSGAAGGIVFSMLMMAIVLGSAVGFRALSPRGGYAGTDILSTTFTATAQAYLYAYCYCLTVLFVQRSFLPRLKPTLTWVVLLCVFALGMIVPYIIYAFIVMAERDRWDHNRHSYLLVTNPFVAIYDSANPSQAWRGYENRLLFWMFLIVWTALATLLSVRWVFAQFASFRRVDIEPSQEAPEAMEDATAPAGGAVP